MNHRRAASTLPVLLALLTLSCTELPETRAHLDARTGASLIAVTRPWVFARERRDVAVNARDYLNLVAAEIDEAGRHQIIVAAHRWSTIDSRATGELAAAPGNLLLVVDGRDIVLLPLTSRDAGDYARSRTLLPPPDSKVDTTIYAVDAQTLGYAATGRNVVASFPDAPLALPYASWSDGRKAISQLLGRIAPP